MTATKHGAAKRLEEVNAVLEKIKSFARIEIADDLEAGPDGEKISTVMLATGSGQKFAIYATGSSIGLNTYLRGLHHGLCMIAGGYQFKALNEAAWELPRSSIINAFKPVELISYKKQSPSRINARTDPRFAFQRSKYTRM